MRANVLGAMRKPRTAKPAMSLWLADNTDRLGLTPADVAVRVGVSESTVRGWEAGRSIGSASVAALERMFGLDAPEHEGAAGDQNALVLALATQAAAISDLVAELRLARLEQAEWNRGVQDVVRSLAERLAPAPPTNDREHALPGGAQP